MKLSKFIEELQKIQIEAGDNDPPVVLADWAENYALPAEWPAETITFCNCEYREKLETQIDQVVMIGSY